MKKETYVVIALIMSTMINTFLCAVVAYALVPIYTGNYGTEDINVVARIQRGNYISRGLKNEIELAGNKILPMIIVALSSKDLTSPQEVIFGDYVIYINMDSDSLNGLTKEETKAVIAHGIGHYMLGHTQRGRISDEISADRFASQYVNSKVLAGVIDKIVYDDVEKLARLQAIGVGN